jgi:hypothetical protein
VYEPAAPSLLPSPGESRATPNVLAEVQRLLLICKDDSITRGKNRIHRQEVLGLEAAEKAHEARMDAARARSGEGGFFDGMGTAIEAFTTDLISLDTLTDPQGQFERSADKAGSAVDTPQFWADLQSGALEVGKWVGVAVSCVLAVASWGAATPIAALAIAGAVLSSAAAADSTFGIMEKLGVDAETASWVNMGMSLTGALCSGGAGIGQAFSKTAATATETAVRSASTAGTLVSAGASATGAAARAKVAAFERDAKMADADLVEATALQQRADRRIQAVITAIKETLESTGRGLSRVNQAASDYHATRVATMRA